MGRDHQDTTLPCVRCGCRFTWTAPEQRFYEAKLLHPPLRCPACRKQRRSTISPYPYDGQQVLP